MVMLFNLEDEFKWCVETLHQQIAGKVASGSLTHQQGQELHYEVEHRLEIAAATDMYRDDAYDTGMSDWQHSQC